MKIILAATLALVATTSAQTEPVKSGESVTGQQIAQKAKNPSKRPNGIYLYDRISKKTSIA